MNKSYGHDHAEKRSREAYELNVKRIREHNEAAQFGKYSFEIRANNMADLSPSQYMKTYVRLKSSPLTGDKYDPVPIAEPEEDMVGAVHTFDPSVPDILDWRAIGFKTASKNQKSCGSCYAFSIALSIEGQVFRRTGKLIALSEQQIIDCSTGNGNHGCAGGSLRNTFKYLNSTRGLMRDQDYPYVSSVSWL